MSIFVTLAQFTPSDPETRKWLLVALAAFIVLFPILVGLFLVRTWAQQRRGKRSADTDKTDGPQA